MSAIIRGPNPAIVMMHGFPDDSRIHDRIIPLLMPHRTVAFGWPGYGRFDRTDTARFTSADHQAALGAVLDALGSSPPCWSAMMSPGRMRSRTR
jgi:haloalkane dehalogenase